MKEVTFMEAIKALSEGYAIACKMDGLTKIFSNYKDIDFCILSDENTRETWGEALSASEILNGKWFIK